MDERLKKLKPYEPVSGDFSSRLDANESPWDLPDDLLAGIRVAFNRYPDPNADLLIEAFCKKQGLPKDCAVAGNGSDELIGLLCGIFAGEGPVVTLSPDFSMYRFYCDLYQKPCLVLEKKEDRIDVSELSAFAAANQATMVIFSNPCNPTSLVLEKAEVLRLAEELNGRGTLLVVDEAYMEFSDQSVLNEVEKFPNLVVLRTLSKAYAAAGLRLGFAAAEPEIIRIFRAAKSPYNVNVFSQAAGVAILEDPRVEERIAALKAGAAELYQGISALPSLCGRPFEICRPSTNFVWLKTSAAARIEEAFRKAGVAVRLFPGALRISAGRPEENRKVLEILRGLS